MLMSSSPMARSRMSPSRRGERWREHVMSDGSYDGARYMVTVRSAKVRSTDESVYLYKQKFHDFNPRTMSWILSALYLAPFNDGAAKIGLPQGPTVGSRSFNAKKMAPEKFIPSSDRPASLLCTIRVTAQHPRRTYSS